MNNEPLCDQPRWNHIRHRCCCVFDHDSEAIDPIVECKYHSDLRAEIERLTRRLEGATRLLNAWHFEYHHGRRLEGIDDDTTTWLGGIDVPDRAADQPEPQDDSHD